MVYNFEIAFINKNLSYFVFFLQVLAPLGVNTPWYTMNGFSSDSSSLIFTTGASPYGIHSSTVLRVWYGEDLYDSTEGDNGGQACVNIYGLI